MTSWQVHLLNLIVRFHMRRLRKATDAKAARAVLSGKAWPLPGGVSARAATLGGVPGEWVLAGLTNRNILLYLHGGAYVACSPGTHRPITGAFAKRGFAVFAPNYRLAPEHPFPAAVEDVEAVWLALRAAGHPAETIALAGDSAGGGLAPALMLRLRDKGGHQPAAAALFSPWTELSRTEEEFRLAAVCDPTFASTGHRLAADAYLGGADPWTPLASRVFADLKGLPPLLIHFGEREVLKTDSIRIAETARAAGVETAFRMWPVVPHVWQIAPFVPEARQSINLAAAFLADHLTIPRANFGAHVPEHPAGTAQRRPIGAVPSDAAR